MFYFRLHPLQWQFEGDGDQLFRALELADGSYLISWKMNNETVEIIMASEDVTESIVKHHWIIEE